MSHTEPDSPVVSKEGDGRTTEAAPPAGITTTPSSSAAAAAVGDTKKRPSKLGTLLGQGFRILCLDLPLFILLAGYAGMMLADYAKEEFFAAQYEGLIWDGSRKAEEIT